MTGADTEASILIIMGSARSDGDTAKAVRRLSSRLPSATTLVDLSAMHIKPFDHGNPAQEDDFDEIAALMLRHRALVFATPVYWYAMSGPMKILFDRLSDLLSGRDPARRGRALAGRDVWLLAVGTDPALPQGFERPFQMTADYLAMKWRGAFYVCTGKIRDQSPSDEFAAELSARSSAAT